MIVQFVFHRIPANNKSSEGYRERHDLKAMSIDELWTLHDAATFELNQKLAAEKAKLEQRLGELQGDDDVSGPDPPALRQQIRMVMKLTRLSEPIASVMFERDNSTKGPSLTVGSIDRPGPPHVPLLFLISNLCVKSGFFLFDLLAQPLKRPNLLD